ncbi:MAG: hypothetical protein AAF830_06245 [Pseudomonadota bacterium]
MNLLKTIAAGAASIAATVGFALAAPVVGGTVGLDAENGGFSVFSDTETVQPGFDFVIFDAQFDVDAGTSRDIVQYEAAPGSFGGIFSVTGRTEITFTLPLSGTEIVGALVTSSIFTNTVATWTADTLTVAFDEGAHNGGEGFAVHVTYRDTMSQVPVPAAALLFAPAALAFARRRKAA